MAWKRANFQPETQSFPALNGTQT